MTTAPDVQPGHDAAASTAAAAVSGTVSGPDQLLDAKYPVRADRLRKVIHLWGSYYRINYHDPDKSNYIVESHFVLATPEGVEELK